MLKCSRGKTSAMPARKKKKQHMKDVLQDIQEGRDTSCEDEIYCPWCGVIIECDADTPEAYEDGTHTIDCPEVFHY